jgi:hypothetical protein
MIVMIVIIGEDYQLQITIVIFIIINNYQITNPKSFQTN